MRVGPALVTAILAVTSRALAAPATDPDELVRAANAAAASGDYAGAAARFLEAYAADRRPELICNVGVAYDKARDLPRAQRYLATCVQRGSALEPKFMASVHRVLAAIDAKLLAGSFAPVNIVVEPEGASVTISDFGERERLVGSQLVWLPFGSHELTTRAEGYTADTRTLSITTRASVPVTIKLERAAAVPLPPPAVVHEPPAPVRAPREVTTVVPVDQHAAHVMTVVTGIAALATIGTYVVAYHERGKVDAAASATMYNDQKSTALDWRYGLIGAGAATVILGGVTAYLWTHPHATTRTEVIVAPTPGGAAAMLSGSF